jgi:hypothetical protein
MPEQTQTPDSRPPAPLRAPNNASALEEITERADTVWTRGSGKPVSVKTTERRDLKGPRGRVAIVDGCRTPFIKAGTDFQNMDVIDLASIPAAELLARTGIDPELIDLSVFGVVVPALHAPNLGREVVFRTSMPMRVPGVTVNLACASSTRAITFGAGAILTGEADIVLAGGAESLSNVPIQFSRKAAHIFMELSRAKTLPQRVGILSKLRPADLAPVAPAIAEYTTGQSMGESAEKMAKENDISRRAQDEIALLSHHRAAAATADGRLTAQIAPACGCATSSWSRCTRPSPRRCCRTSRPSTRISSPASSWGAARRSAASTSTSSTSTAARSRSAPPSAPPAPGGRCSCSSSCAAAAATSG